MLVSMNDLVLIMKNFRQPSLYLRTLSNITELFSFFSYLNKVHIRDIVFLINESIPLSDTKYGIEPCN